MPANSDTKSAYYHVYCRGIENKILFSDKQDYDVFLEFLREYLSPVNTEEAKKDFSIKGRTFRGTPHQPKNYYRQVDLMSYCIMPYHIHLLLYQSTPKSVEKLIRSLCTRYSMYFNKKYHRSGPLFRGPYKSVLIKDEYSLLFLTRYLHSADYSSYPEYSGIRNTPWVKPTIVLSFFEQIKNNSLKGINSYKDFVEDYQLEPKEKELLAGLTLETQSHHLEDKSPANNVEKPTEALLKPIIKPRRRVPELLAAGAGFFLLVSIGFRNVSVSTNRIVAIPTPSPSVLPQSVELETEPEVKPETKRLIKIAKVYSNVIIRQGPTPDSKKIGKANGGDTFEFVSLDLGWYEIKLTDGSAGFISAEYIEAKEEIDH